MSPSSCRGTFKYVLLVVLWTRKAFCFATCHQIRHGAQTSQLGRKPTYLRLSSDAHSNGVRDSPLKTENDLNGVNVEWEVYVDQSKPSLERGASATLDAFVGLAPPEVRVIPAILPKSKGAKGPIVRCVAVDDETDCLEISNVASVDKVYRILTRHMRVQGVDASARECLKWKYKGNGHLEEGDLSLAIDAYDKALEMRFSEQEGIILLMRSSAYLQLASVHQKELKELVEDLSRSVPDTSTLQLLYEEAARHPSLASAIFKRIVLDTKAQERKFRQTKFRHGVYQYALLHAAQDSLRATQLLSNYSNSWLRAGEVLEDLWKLKESAQYYEKAVQLDSSLSDSLSPVIERLRKRQELLNSARAYGWSEDTLRLALDVAG
jgi:hypothetical protein